MANPPAAASDDEPSPRHAAQAGAENARWLADLPVEMIERVLVFLQQPDLVAANATSRLFRGAPGGRSPVEHALRALARACGLERAIPRALPPGVCTWTAELLALLRTHELAHAHAAVVACSRDTCDDVFCAFSAFVDAEGGLHTCGEEADLDEDEEPTGEATPPLQLGHPDAHTVLVPTRVASLSAVRVRSVAAGWTHLLALSDAGAVYGCGWNGHGQLGMKDIATRRAFELIRGLEPQLVTCIASCGWHSLALSAAGAAYSWGLNGCGQLGHCDVEERWEPTRIAALDGVRVGGVAAGVDHTLLLSTTGAVYSCGQGDCGALGHGNNDHEPLPTRIEALAGVRAVHVSAGPSHSLVVDAKGGVHSFGDGTAGCLGRGETSLDQLKPKRIKALKGVRAVRASCGPVSSAVVGADGSVHAFGHNARGALGLGEATRSLLPTRVQLGPGARVVGVALGGQHALYVTADGAAHACGWRSAALGLGMSAAPEEGVAQGDTVDTRTPTRVAHLRLLGQGQQAGQGYQ